MSGGVPAKRGKGTLRGIVSRKDIDITADLKCGTSAATVLTSDISKRYIDINAHYTT